jgi:hypothetical protein
MIYIKLEDIPKTRTRTQLIRVFLRGVGYKSYYNKECTQVQCENSKFRSITELHEIVQSRFENTSLEAVVKIINTIIEESNSVILIYCTQVEKVVVKYVANKAAQWISEYSLKNYYTKKGVDGYSLKDFQKINENS